MVRNIFSILLIKVGLKCWLKAVFFDRVDERVGTTLSTIFDRVGTTLSTPSQAYFMSEFWFWHKYWLDLCLITNILSVTVKMICFCIVRYFRDVQRSLKLFHSLFHRQRNRKFSAQPAQEDYDFRNSFNN